MDKTTLLIIGRTTRNLTIEIKPAVGNMVTVFVEGESIGEVPMNCRKTQHFSDNSPQRIQMDVWDLQDLLRDNGLISQFETVSSFDTNDLVKGNDSVGIRKRALNLDSNLL